MRKGRAAALLPAGEASQAGLRCLQPRGQLSPHRCSGSTPGQKGELRWSPAHPLGSIECFLNISSISVYRKERPIKYHFYSAEMVKKIKMKPDNTQLGPVCWDTDSFVNRGRGSEPEALRMCPAFNPVTPLLGKHPKEAIRRCSQGFLNKGHALQRQN